MMTHYNLFGRCVPRGSWNFKARICVDPDTPPRFNPARSVPFALRDKVDMELERLQKEGTIEPVEFTEWASPIVAF